MSMRFLFILIFCVISLPSMAQIRHVKGLKGVELGYGATRFGGSYNFNYVNHFSKTFYGKADVFFESEKFARVKSNAVGLEFSGSYTVLVIKETLFVNLKGGTDFFLKKLNPGINVTEPTTGTVENKDYSTLKYGFLGGVENEIFITSKWVFVLGGTQRYFLNGGAFGKTAWTGYIGIRYYL